MLEELLHVLQTSEKYTVRLVDEGIHKLVNKPVEWIEYKGIPRKSQADSLRGTTGFGAAAIFLANFLESGYNFFNALIIEDQNGDLAFSKFGGEFLQSFGKYMPFVMGSSIDPDISRKNKKNYQSDGTIAGNPDASSYNSVTGMVRPYALAASVGAVVYGAMTGNNDALKYGALALPWVLSMYVRDDDTGGLFQKMHKNLKSMFLYKHLKPAAQPT